MKRLKVFPFTIGSVPIHCWKCSHSLLEVFPFTVGSVPIHCWKCSHSLLEVFPFTVKNVPIHYWKCSHSLLSVIGRQLQTVEASCKREQGNGVRKRKTIKYFDTFLLTN